MRTTEEELMPRGNACRGACGRNISKWRTWCQWCKPVHIRRDNIAAIDHDPLVPGALRVTLIPDHKPRVVYIHPGPAALITQAIRSRDWMPPPDIHDTPDTLDTPDTGHSHG